MSRQQQYRDNQRKLGGRLIQAALTPQASAALHELSGKFTSQTAAINYIILNYARLDSARVSETCSIVQPK